MTQIQTPMQTPMQAEKTIQAGADRKPGRPPFPHPVLVGRSVLVALPCALVLALLFPVTASAQAVGFRSVNLPADPTGATIFTLTMMTVIELGAVFWVGIHLWLHLSRYVVSTRQGKEGATDHQGLDGVAGRIALSILLVLLLAHIALVIEQAVTLSGGTVLLFCLVRLFLLLLAMHLSLYQRRLRQLQGGSLRRTSLLSWINLFLGLLLFVILALSNDPAAARLPLTPSPTLAAFLYLLAATLLVYGMLSIATHALPLSNVRPFAERVRSQMLLLPSSFPWVMAGGVLMVLAGGLSATTHLSAWEQLRTTVYGQVLTLGGILVGLLLLIMAVHLFLLRQHVKKAYVKYVSAVAHAVGSPQEAPQRTTVLAHRVKRREARLTMQAHQLRLLFSLEVVFGVGVVICFSLLNIFASNLLPPVSAQYRSQAAGPFQRTVTTFDQQFEVALTITPNRFGPNVFTMTVIDAHTGTPLTTATISLITKMGEMDMGTLTLQSDGHGVFRTNGDMAMSGDWQIIMQIITPDTVLHEAYVTLFTPL